MSAKGINLGAGKGWKFPDCKALDALTGSVLDEETLLPAEDGSIDYVFSSHFFEHVDDRVSAHLLRESHRVLRVGGVIRISVPDFDKLLDKYRAGDAHFLGLPGKEKKWDKKDPPQFRKYHSTLVL